MNKNPLVSVIIPTRNSAQFLDRCLKSIQKQTYKNIELIVVDNNSTDNTKEIAKKYTDKVFNKGPERSIQRNYGAMNSRGDFLLFIDSDMDLAADVIYECVQVIIKSKNVYSVIIPEQSVGSGFWARCKTLERSFYVGISWIEASRFYNKKIFNNLGGYDINNTGTEDYDLPQRLIEKYSPTSIGRINSYIFHIEENISLLKSIQKKIYYAQKLNVYRINNEKYFLKQSSIIERYKLFFSKPRILFKDPYVGLGMLFMKTCEFFFAGMSYLTYTHFKKNVN